MLARADVIFRPKIIRNNDLSPRFLAAYLWTSSIPNSADMLLALFYYLKNV
jgi:hypothetical protein